MCYHKVMKPVNISSLIKKYGSGYIAKSKKTGRVIAHAKRLDILFKKTGKKSDITISWLPKGGAKYVFRISQLFLPTFFQSWV